MSTMMILILAGVAFIVWHFLPEPKPPGPQPRFRRDPFVRLTDPAWQERIEQQCESPAEVAFLRAMIQAHDLKPDAGTLVGDKIKIDLQVQEDRYRVDFLANEWLVIEIDGAAWHSSKEAIERDRIRDEYFVGLGYSVVRIAAKTVFNTPLQAVEKVNAALRVGKKQIAPSSSRSGFVRLSETMAGASKMMSEINDHTAQITARRRALQPIEMAIHREKTIISAAMDHAKRKMELKTYLADDPTMQKAYDDHMKTLQQAFEKYDRGRGVPVPKEQPMQVTPIPRPILLHDDMLNGRIEEGYTSMMNDRQDFLNNVRREASADERLKELLSAYLVEHEQEAALTVIFGEGGQRPIANQSKPSRF